MKKLTYEECEFATKNHSLVTKFLKGKHLKDEYYDIIIFGYLKAVTVYVNNIDLQKEYEFAIIANRKMKDALIEHYIYLDRQKRAQEKGAIRYSNCDEISQPPYKSAMEEHIVSKSIYEEIFSMLSKIEKNIILLKLQQYKNREIIEKCNINIKKYYYYINNIQRKLGSKIDVLLS